MSSKQEIESEITTTQPDSKKKRGKRAGVELFPRHPLKDAIKIPEAIWKENGGKPFNILDLAPATNWSPNSSGFVTLLASSYRYGLTDGSTQTKVISLTPLGMSIVAPTIDTDVNLSYKKSLLHNHLFEKVYSQFDGKPLPRTEVLKNTLIRSTDTGGYGIAREDADAFIEIFMKNIEDFGLGQDIGGTQYLRLDKLGIEDASTIESDDVKIDESIEKDESIDQPTPQKEVPKHIFVGHGKNTKPLEQLKGILDQFEVPYKVAIDEPHEGRPISEKVSDIMRECSSAIFIFTKDEETQDIDGNTVFRPSDNVVYELGAASTLYGKKIVIFKENEVSFGSDFKDLGYISFDTDQLDAKTMELMKELIRFGLLKVSAA